MPILIFGILTMVFFVLYGIVASILVFRFAPRPLASNVLREAGLEELYSPCNAHHLVEQALCPDAGDGDILRPEVFSGNLAGCLEALKDSDDPAVRALADGELAPLLQNKELLNAYMGLMIGG